MKLEDVKIGSPVTYYSIITKGGQKIGATETEITSVPWELGCGEIVCKVKGKSGSVSIRHLELR